MAIIAVVDGPEQLKPAGVALGPVEDLDQNSGSCFGISFLRSLNELAPVGFLVSF